jgi:hypothetical protein
MRDLVILVGLALALRTAAALLVPAPPYIDAAYYELVAERLADGYGFSVPVLYSFLEVGGTLPADPGLPVPSNGHWMPLASIIAAAPMTLFGSEWRIGQVPMVVLSVALVAITHSTAWELFHSRRTSLLASVLMIFPGPLLIMLPLVDGFAPFGVAGALAIYTAIRAVRAATASNGAGWLIASGALVGVATLVRIDGLFLAVAPAAAWWSRRRVELPTQAQVGIGPALASAAACVLVLAPWFVRNLAVFGAVLPSTGGHTLWITSYNEQFTIGSEVSFATFLASGPAAIIGSRMAAIVELAGRSISLGGGIFVIFTVGGAWRLRHRPEVKPFLAYWLVMFAAMALLFTHHAPKGAFVHSAPAWLPAASAIGAGSVGPVSSALGRWWPFLRRTATHRFLEVAGLVAASLISLIASAVLLAQWREANSRLAPATDFLREHARPDAVVMYPDPSRLYLLTGNPGVAPPFDPYAVVAQVIRAYDVEWLVVTLDVGETRDPLGLWDGLEATDINGEHPSFIRDGPAFEALGVRVYEVVP